MLAIDSNFLPQLMLSLHSGDVIEEDLEVGGQEEIGREEQGS